MTDRPQAGFTLLELLVAVAIFAVVSAMAYGGLQTVLETRDRVEAEGERLGELQLAQGVLARDLRQHLDRPWIDAWGDRRPALGYDALDAEPRLELITAAGRQGPQQSVLRRIGYELEDGVLYRLGWTSLDGGEEEPQTRSRLAGTTEEESRRRIEAVRFTFHYRDPDGTLQETDRWPPDAARGEAGRLLALGVTLELGNGEEIPRLFAARGTDHGNRTRTDAGVE